ncbi:hypothetical protein HanRHA438_Chr11g0500441 [Helianthus annuus]|uniref:Uncharacterized protein n=1 Tax=Helianthus annuus TaxID=4232 RepID=A0A9K3HNV0_HELAN|nr:hypothetical protein HanXRQr2_Chr11g0487671 [Helianthus annuus]KAJ0501326.1 hypothetical protein HanHA300_Chr11g0399541 [Helianthus annuus]KAJ0517233.1 hypothetical protein HanHA89_Chr11g0423021 [Helianthus annuus]KAJ0685241.1 hypothetical protein HanLR1_Chr11g0400441 [Helianthus annuus]KAJ0689148.1 hypothetical protein HanOQP8_Chr11g0402431 [Helianthus annuus]
MICLSENYYLVWSYLQEKKSEALFFFSYVCDFDIRFSRSTKCAKPELVYTRWLVFFV